MFLPFKLILEEVYFNKPQVDGGWKLNRLPGGFPRKPLTSRDALNGLLDVFHPDISVLEMRGLEEVVLLLGGSELHDKLEENHFIMIYTCPLHKGCMHPRPLKHIFPFKEFWAL